jgi:hypothetical protein
MSRGARARFSPSVTPTTASGPIARLLPEGTQVAFDTIETIRRQPHRRGRAARTPDVARDRRRAESGPEGFEGQEKTAGASRAKGVRGHRAERPAGSGPCAAAGRSRCRAVSAARLRHDQRQRGEERDDTSPRSGLEKREPGRKALTLPRWTIWRSPIRRPTRARFASDCDRSRPLRRRTPPGPFQALIAKSA